MIISDPINIEEILSPSISNIKEDFKVKIVLLGDSGVGKTNLISRFTKNMFSPNSKATIGVEFFIKTYKVNNKILKIEIWDTAGQERYKSITSVYYKGAKGAFIVYDITSRKSFDDVDKWIEEIKEKTSKDIKLIIIGNKIDLKDERDITTNEALNKFKGMDIPFMETSALDDTNVSEVFLDLIKIIYQDIIKGDNDEYFFFFVKKSTAIDLNNIENTENNKKKKYFCCY